MGDSNGKKSSFNSVDRVYITEVDRQHRFTDDSDRQIIDLGEQQRLTDGRCKQMTPIDR